MSYELIICEKPSAAKNIANALADGKALKRADKGVAYYEVTHGNKDIVVVSAVGHLYGLAQKDKKGKWRYPIFEIEWVPTSEMNKSAKFTAKYLNVIKKLAKKAKSFVVACDYDVEGEVIGLNIVRFAAKQKDARRMKFSTQTKPDLIKAYENASPQIDWGQAEAGETRHKLDWFFGINLSRALTDSIKAAGSFKIMSTGRVQGPALKMVVEKEKEIGKFKAVPYWEIEFNGNSKKDILAMHEKDKFWDKKEADVVMKNIKGKKQAEVSKVEARKFQQKPPVPFDLTSLQIESHKVLHISPKQTLSLAQELYTAGCISYPRTSSQKLPKEIGYKKILKALSKQSAYIKETDMLLKLKVLVPSEGKKKDPAHPAIFPTGIVPKGLKGGEAKLYDLIVRRFLAVFGEPAVRETLKIHIDCNKEIFIAKGTTTVEKGWHVLYGKYAMFKDEELPRLVKGDKIKVKKIALLSKETQPPKRYTESSIIKELEKRGLGTKATRANIVDTLVQRGYVSGKPLEATELGMRVIKTLTKYCPTIVDQELTREFENDMENIREKKSSQEKILKGAIKVLMKIFKDFDKHKVNIGKALLAAHRESQDKASYLGQCPKCKKNDLHIRFGKFGKFVACSGYPDCKTTYSLPHGALVRPAKKDCQECGLPMVLVIRKGARPREVCINPDCPSKKLSGDEAKKVEELEKHERKCPKCKTGNLVVRRSVYGTFFGCSKYPKCKYTEKLVEDDKFTKNKKPVEGAQVVDKKKSVKIKKVVKVKKSVKSKKK